MPDLDTPARPARRNMPRNPTEHDVETHRKWAHEAVDRVFRSWRIAVAQERDGGAGFPSGHEGAAGGEGGSLPERLVLAAAGGRYDPETGEGTKDTWRRPVDETMHAHLFLAAFHNAMAELERADHRLAQVDPAARPSDGDGWVRCRSKHAEPVEARAAGRCRWCADFIAAQKREPTPALLAVHDEGRKVTPSMIVEAFGARRAS